MAYDILIKSATIIDGTGSQPQFGDIGITGEYISDIGDLGNAGATIVINGFGKYVTPGFVDITNHSDTHLTLFKYPGLESALMQGVTTIIGGNCGASLAPLGRPEAISAIRRWADPSEINVSWATVDEYLKSLESFSFGANFGTLIGYGTLRRGIIGDTVRELNFEEQEELKNLLRSGMAEGAYGLSLGLTYNHERISTTEEILEYGKIAAASGGILKMHLRSEGFDLLSSVNEAIRITREAGVSVQISHLKAIGKKAWPLLPKALELIARARESGLNISFDVSPYQTTGSLLYLLIPGWARHGGFTELFKRIDNKIEREKILEALRSYTLHYDKILITSAKIKTIVGQSLAEIAQRGGFSPEEALVEVVRVNEGRVTIRGRTLSMENTVLALQDKHSFVASDGPSLSVKAETSGDLLHPRAFGAFPRFLGRFAPRLNIPIAEAVWKISGGPAEKMGILRRGTIKKRNFADITIFDPKIIKDRATYKNPYRYPAGIEWVIVNGKVAVEQGKYMGVRGGKILRRG